MPNRTSDGHHDGPRFPGVSLLGSLDFLPSAAKFALSIPARRMTPGQSRRLYRDALIHAGRKCGMSHRQLAAATGLPRSRIQVILKAPPTLPKGKT